MNRGFSLVELVLMVAVVLILAAIGAWNLTGLRDEATAVTQNDNLATVQRMEQLAALEGLAPINTTPLERLVELQSLLTAKGHRYHHFNPTNLASQLQFAGGQWSIR